MSQWRSVWPRQCKNHHSVPGPATSLLQLWTRQRQCHKSPKALLPFWGYHLFGDSFLWMFDNYCGVLWSAGCLCMHNRDKSSNMRSFNRFTICASNVLPSCHLSLPLKCLQENGSNGSVPRWTCQSWRFERWLFGRWCTMLSLIAEMREEMVPIGDLLMQWYTACQYLCLSQFHHNIKDIDYMWSNVHITTHYWCNDNIAC